MDGTAPRESVRESRVSVDNCACWGLDWLDFSDKTTAMNEKCLPRTGTYLPKEACVRRGKENVTAQNIQNARPRAARFSNPCFFKKMLPKSHPRPENENARTVHRHVCTLEDHEVSHENTITKLTKSRKTCVRRHVSTLEDHKQSHTNAEITKLTNRKRLVRADTPYI